MVGKEIASLVKDVECYIRTMCCNRLRYRRFGAMKQVQIRCVLTKFFQELECEYRLSTIGIHMYASQQANQARPAVIAMCQNC